MTEAEEEREKPKFTNKKTQIIRPFSSEPITYKINNYQKNKDYYLEVRKFNEKRLTPLQIVDAIVNKSGGVIMVHNPTDCPITIGKGEIMGNALSTDTLDEAVEKEIEEQVHKYAYFTRTLMKSMKQQCLEHTTKETKYAEEQPDQPPGPKTAEVPEFEDIPKSQLIESLDINPKLDKNQRYRLEKILKTNHQAFSLDGRIGKYEGIQYEI